MSEPSPPAGPDPDNTPSPVPLDKPEPPRYDPPGPPPPPPPSATPPPAYGPGPDYGTPPPAYGTPPPYAPPGSIPPAYTPAGEPLYEPVGPAYPPYAPPRLDGVAVGSIIMSVLGIPMSFCFCLGVPMCIAGIIMGFVARHRIAESEGRLSGDGIALAAIIVGAAGIALFTLFSLSLLLSSGRSTL